MTLKNCRLIPELSGGLEITSADIRLEAGIIADICQASATPLADGDVDCTGMTVLPGLFDLHVHLVNDREPDDIYNAFRLYHKTASELGVFLDYGVTTIRDCGSTMDLSCYLRDGVNCGLFEGPRILSGGRIISPEAMCKLDTCGIYTIANGVEEVRKAARHEFAVGADFIKIYSTQSMSQVNGQDPRCIYDADEIAAMVAVAKKHNSYVASHAHSSDAINTCIRGGVRSIEHATYLDSESIQLFLDTPDAYAVFTHACGELYHDGDGYNDPETVKFWSTPYMIESKKRCRALENEAYRAGVKIGFATDTDPASFSKYPYEFQIRKEACGMENTDILLQATKMSAEIVMLKGITGEIRKGYIADIIAVKGNPDEDLSVMYKKPVIVIKSGKVKRLFGEVWHF